jgi:hypothetical protein
MDNGVRCIEKYIPNFLHGRTSGLDVVIEGVVLPSDIHHKGRDKSAMPNMMIDVLWKVRCLGFFVAIGNFGLLYKGNECLVIQIFDTS